jgi:hypothetical protein
MLEDSKKKGALSGDKGHRTIPTIVSSSKNKRYHWKDNVG